MQKTVIITVSAPQHHAFSGPHQRRSMETEDLDFLEHPPPTDVGVVHAEKTPDAGAEQVGPVFSCMAARLYV